MFNGPCTWVSNQHLYYFVSLGDELWPSGAKKKKKHKQFKDYKV